VTDGVPEQDVALEALAEARIDGFERIVDDERKADPRD
jgi:hypothetical protein